MRIVHDNWDVVLRQNAVRLDEVHTHLIGHRDALKRVFWKVAACTAVCDHDLSLWCLRFSLVLNRSVGQECGYSECCEEDVHNAVAFPFKVKALKKMVRMQQTAITEKTPFQPNLSAMAPTPVPAMDEPKT